MGVPNAVLDGPPGTMGDVKVVVSHSAKEFVEHAWAYLTSRPIEHNVMATVVSRLEPTETASTPLFAWVQAGTGDEVSAAALRTPPRPLLASSMTAEAAGALMPKLLEAVGELPGVNGPHPAARYLAEAWQRCTGGTAAKGMSLAIYWLEHVDQPRCRPAGHPRRAGPAERELLMGWTLAFMREVGVPEADVERSVDRRLREGQLFVWDDERIVCMVGTSPPVAGVIRLAPVYTPPEARRHGYATALVADVSRRSLAADATKCMLYADLANPTSNSIYRAVGYRRTRNAQEYLFRR